MEAAAYSAFTDALSRRLAGDPRVVGLVALGSMSGDGPAPDGFSDHDFFVLTEPGAQEGFRTELSWLPGAEDAVLVHRETEHGLKVVLPDGHLLELAVFDLDELSVAGVDRWSVALDRGAVEERMAEIAAASATRRLPDPAHVLGELVTAAASEGRRWISSSAAPISTWVARDCPSSTGARSTSCSPGWRRRRAERLP